MLALQYHDLSDVKRDVFTVQITERKENEMDCRIILCLRCVSKMLFYRWDLRGPGSDDNEEVLFISINSKRIIDSYIGINGENKHLFFSWNCFYSDCQQYSSPMQPRGKNTFQRFMGDSHSQLRRGTPGQISNRTSLFGFFNSTLPKSKIIINNVISS